MVDVSVGSGTRHPQQDAVQVVGAFLREGELVRGVDPPAVNPAAPVRQGRPREVLGADEQVGSWDQEQRLSVDRTQKASYGEGSRFDLRFRVLVVT